MTSLDEVGVNDGFAFTTPLTMEENVTITRITDVPITLSHETKIKIILFYFLNVKNNVV